MDTDFHNILMDDKIANDDKEISIGDYVWVGMNCTILKGAGIPSGSVIAANSIITKKLPKKDSVYVNHDIVRENIRWEP